VNGKFVEQHERMKRSYLRFSALDQGRPHDMPSEHYVDEVYSFFQNCYHLKDWIKNDPTVPQIARLAVEPYINSTRSLRLCADICNSAKHLTLGSPRSGENPTFGTKKFALNLGAGPATISLKYQVDTDSGPMDAFQLGTECVEAWETFLSSHGLK
jgi:hypothetical protein